MSTSSNPLHHGMRALAPQRGLAWATSTNGRVDTPAHTPGQTGEQLSGQSSRQARPQTRFRDSAGMRILVGVLETALGILLIAGLAALVHTGGWLPSVAALLYLLIVVPTALLCGFRQAVVVSLSAVLIHSYLAVRTTSANPAADPANSVTLLVFVITALVVSHLSSKVSEHARMSKSRMQQIESLYEFTRLTLLMNLLEEPGMRLAELVLQIFDIDAIVIYDSDLHAIYEQGDWGGSPVGISGEMVQNAYHFDRASDDPATGLSRRVLRMGNLPIGAMVVRGATSALIIDAIASLIAVTFDRYRAFLNEGQVVAERKTEQLRTTVLDSLAHAYKTPLTAIRAASTGLDEMGDLTKAQQELVGLIDEQTSLLNDLTTRLLSTARLDAQDVMLKTMQVDMVPLVDELVASFRERLETTPVSLLYSDTKLMLECDRQLVTALLTQYLDNAYKYSTAGSLVSIKVEAASGEIVFSVHSQGPLIPLMDRDRIFDRFFRSQGSSSLAPGTGVGLSIAKRAASLHGGHVWVISEHLKGSTFYAALPTAGIGHRTVGGYAA